MTRNEAIDLLDNLIGMVEDNHNSDYDTALRMGIKSLSQEPTTVIATGDGAYYKIKALQEPCEDAISRQALLDAFGFSEKTRKWGGDHSGYNTMMLYEIQDVIESQPLVKPQEPKTGHWIYDYTSADGHKTYHCSECGCYLQPKHSEPLNSFKWCSSCGVKMIEPQESEEV